MSACEGGTLKVWDVANPRPYIESEWEEVNETRDFGTRFDPNKVQSWWRNKMTGHEQPTKPTGGALVVTYI